MHIIKLDATDSTNLYLKNQLLLNTFDDFTVVVAHEQTKARGQMGTTWQSAAGKNLTFSILRKFNELDVYHQFYLNIAVSLAVYALLSTLKTPKLKIKWPNDIMSGNHKICGILIENTLQGQQIKTSVIGVGLNVNQTNFYNLFNATSLKLLLDKNFNLEELLCKVLEQLDYYFKIFETGNFEALKKSYLEVLFMKGVTADFQDSDAQNFTGIITGISDIGQLLVQLNGGVIKAFNMKEIKLLY